MIDIFIEIIGGIFKGILELLGDIFQTLFQSGTKRKQELDADFLSPNSILSVYNKGFALNGHGNLTVKNSYMSSMVLGGSGSGKSVSVCIPTIYNLLKHGHSIIVHDPSGELFRATAPLGQQLEFNLKIIHYSDSLISDGYNPMARANDASGIQKVAMLLVRNALGESKDPFWGTQSVMLISLLMRILKKNNMWYQNLANVKLLLDSMAAKPDALDVLVAKCNDRNILNEYKQFLVMDKKLLISITSTCRAALSIFNDPKVQVVTAFDSIDFDAFRKEKTILFIQNKTGDMKYYSTLSAIFFEQFFAHLMDKLPEKEDKSVFFILDEASSLYLPTLPIALANLRKFKAGIMTIAQDFNQFIHLYGTYEAEAIKSNSYSKIFFPGAPLNTCQELERLLGTFQYADEKGNVRSRALMTTDEIRTMKPNTAIILAGSNRAIFTKMHPYFKSMKYKKLSKLPVPKPSSKVPFEELPLIPLPTEL